MRGSYLGPPISMRFSARPTQARARAAPSLAQSPRQVLTCRAAKTHE
jgi:hypothetical protein